MVALCFFLRLLASPLKSSSRLEAENAALAIQQQASVVGDLVHGETWLLCPHECCRSRPSSVKNCQGWPRARPRARICDKTRLSWRRTRREPRHRRSQQDQDAHCVGSHQGGGRERSNGGDIHRRTLVASLGARIGRRSAGLLSKAGCTRQQRRRRMRNTAADFDSQATKDARRAQTVLPILNVGSSPSLTLCRTCRSVSPRKLAIAGAPSVMVSFMVQLRLTVNCLTALPRLGQELSQTAEDSLARVRAGLETPGRRTPGTGAPIGTRNVQCISASTEKPRRSGPTTPTDQATRPAKDEAFFLASRQI
jgi:hypothetical protein